MIISIGNDITDIRRIEQSLARFGERFENRVFTSGERTKARSRSKAGMQTVAGTYAKRYAAKEACTKALGWHERGGFSWQEIEIITRDSGAPEIRLTGNALKRLQALAPTHTLPHIHLSMSDEYPYAQAFVIIEARNA